MKTLFLCLTATGSDQSVTNQVKIRIKLSGRAGSDYYAWKILITGGRTCPDECFHWLDNNWCSVSYNSPLLIFPFPHIYPCLVDRNIIPRNAGVYLIQQVNLQVTEISDRILWISHGYLVCRNSRLPPHTHHLNIWCGKHETSQTRICRLPARPVAPVKQLSKRTLLRKPENNKDSSNRSVMTFCHL